ncbi:hypothetical protein GCM10007063_28880 [Lentibacillus kapialis]|uniref:Autolysin n=1 Tax=Lentibacillus kapialis TaxID=340214 RepID=A0A917Q0Y9_9BACI|nr:S-layer homology domain-containing protein [Lentibacillus kapialis]GGK04759.1 hypothetical protein GCM10007063_28880 [Lentibacillus kapialis]
MRKSVIVAIIGLLCLFLAPLQFSAEESDSNSDSEEYNEFGIKKGTEIFGEDISEYSEEELKYVPKAWRDGEIEESEHPGARTDGGKDRQVKLQRWYPDVNHYINSNNLKVAETEYNYIRHLPKFDYRFKDPEGIVAHETANDNSNIDGEISYMSRNYQNAFVHAFVDHKEIVEVHPTDYAAWGAGPIANQRFIHVELVRVDSFDQFARSINNYSSYIAELLSKYELGYNNAEWDKEGTLWSHKAVSRWLGGTNHVDPHGYFERYGYDWASFSELVYAKLQNMSMKTNSTSKLGRINSKDARIYRDPENGDFQKAGETYTGHVYYIKKQGKLRGQTYYLISNRVSSQKGTIGWVNSKDIKVQSHTVSDKGRKLMTIKGSGAAFDKAWGGKEDKVYTSSELSNMAGDILDVDRSLQIGHTTWYRGILNGKQVFMHSRHVKEFSDTVFDDVPIESSHFHTIYELVNQNIIKGYPNREYRPGESLTRSHAAAIFANTLNLPVPNDVAGVLKNYDDIGTSHMYAEQIAAAYEADIFTGSDGSFMDKSLTREQMATVISKAFDLQDTGGGDEIHLSNVSPDHRRNVKLLAQHGITVELEDFRSYENVTRGQFATFISKAMNN